MYVCMHGECFYMLWVRVKYCRNQYQNIKIHDLKEG